MATRAADSATAALCSAAPAAVMAAEAADMASDGSKDVVVCSPMVASVRQSGCQHRFVDDVGRDARRKYMGSADARSRDTAAPARLCAAGGVAELVYHSGSVPVAGRV